MTSNEQQDVLVLSGTRTAIGKYGGLTDMPPGDVGHAVSGRPGTGRQSFRQPREVVK